METLANGFTLELSPDAFPLSTDSIALSGFVRLPREAQVLDLGSGCGTLGLMLCAAFPDCTVTGVELEENAHRMALHNANANQLTARLKSICADWAAIASLVEAGSFSCCVSNPPYFAGGFRSQTLPKARHEESDSLESWFRAAAWALRWGGDFYFVHRPERLAELCARAVRHRLEPKRLCLLRHRADGPVTLVLLGCRKGAKPGLKWEEACLFHADGTPTEYYRTLYHL